LYKHVQSLDHLKDLMTIAALDEAAHDIGTAVMGRSGRDALEAFLGAYRAYAQRRPHRWTLIEHPDPADPAVAASAARLVEVASAVVRGFGLPEAELVDAVRTLRAAVTGFISLEQGGGFQLGRDPGESYRYLVRVLAAGLGAR
jgi:hypothetical protein